MNAERNPALGVGSDNLSRRETDHVRQVNLHQNFWVLLTIIPMAWTGTAQAKTKARDVEVNLQFSYFFLGIDEDRSEGITGDDVNLLSLQGRLGYFLDDEVSVESTLTLVHEDTGPTTAFALDFRPNYHFNTEGAVVPFIGGSMGVMHVDTSVGDDTGFLFGAQAGIKSFLSERVAFTTEYNLRRFVGGDTSATINGVFLGISYFFR